MPAMFASLVTLIIAVVVAAGMWATAQSEVDDLLKQQSRLQADLRHFKGIAWKMQDFENQSIHAAQMETMNLARSMQAEIDACKAGK